MDIDVALDIVLAIARRWQAPEDPTLRDGFLIGRCSWVAPQAFLHKLYPSAGEEMISAVAPAVGRQPPIDFRRLLLRHNGLYLFNNSISIYGARPGYDREADSALWQPFDAGLHNSGLLSEIGRNDLCVGSIGSDADHLILRDATGKLDRCSSDMSRVLQSWENLGTFLIEETTRFASYYDAEGRLLPNLTIPEGGAAPFPQLDMSSIETPRWTRQWWRDQCRGVFERFSAF